MADVKWIKLKVGMFDGMSFKKIKKAKIGGESFRDKLTAVWFELMDFAGRCNHEGAFISPREIPFYELSDIATMIDREEEELRLCMSFFINEGMVSVVDDVYMLSNWSEYQNVDGLEKIKEQNRLRQAKFKQRQKAICGGEICQYCGKPATGQDHIIPTAKGGADTEDNKVYCCADCNRIKNDKPLVEFLNSNRDRIKDSLVTQNYKLRQMVTLDNVTNRYSVTQGNAIEKELDKDLEKEEDIKEINKEKTDYQQIIDLYNAICVSLPSVRSLSNARKKEIKARLNAYSVDDIKQCFENAEASSFLTGYNDRKWTASFDWIMKDSNFAKVLDGNYADKTVGISSSFDINDIPTRGFEDMVVKSWDEKEEPKTAGNDENIKAKAEALKADLAGK